MKMNKRFTTEHSVLEENLIMVQERDFSLICGVIINILKQLYLNKILIHLLRI